MPFGDPVSLAEAKAHLSEVIEGVETEHRRVVITKHGRPSVVVLAVADLESLEGTLEILSDPEVMADLREAEAARSTGTSVEENKEEAVARWSRGRVRSPLVPSRHPASGPPGTGRPHRSGGPPAGHLPSSVSTGMVG